MRHATQILTAAALGLIAVAIASQAQSSTLDAVKKRGDLRCGVNIGLAGFSAPDDKGEWTGLDVDFCRAVASAIFKDPTKVKFVPLSAKERFTALQSGEIDLLSRNTTWTMSRDTQQGLAFVGVTYYDGQGFLVKKSLDLKSVAQLSGASICMQTGTTNELNVADYFRTRSLTYNPVVFEKNEEAVAAFNLGRCDAYTTDASGLYAQRMRIEQSFRDTKNLRVGFGLEIARSRSAPRFEMLLLMAHLASFVQRLIGESAKAQQLELEFMAARRATRREISVLTLGRRILDVAPHYLHRLHPWQAISSLGTQAAFVFTVTA